MSRYDDRDRGYDRGYDRDRGYGRDREREYKVYVGNLPSGASRQEVEDAFGRYGTLKNVWVARNPPGFAFVFFEDERDASDAVDGLNETKLCGAEIRVEHSTGARRGGKFRGGGRNDRCYECGEYGHFARNCYNRRSGGRSSYRGRGHFVYG